MHLLILKFSIICVCLTQANAVTTLIVKPCLGMQEFVSMKEFALTGDLILIAVSIILLCFLSSKYYL